MSDDSYDDEVVKDDISTGKIADRGELIDKIFDAELRDKFELFSYRNAAGILSASFPEHLGQLVD